MSVPAPELIAAEEETTEAPTEATEASSSQNPLAADTVQINQLAEEDAPLEAAEELKAAVADKNETAGDIVSALDNLALRVGHFDISLLDIVLVFVVIAGVITVAWLASRMTRLLLRRVKSLDPSQRLLTEKLVSLAIWALAVLIGIDLLGIDLTALAVFSGAFGLAIGFGLQKTFGNLIAGIILLMDKSIKPGDVIAIADQSGATTFGEIRKIGIRAVSITTRDQKEYLIPNENLMVNQVENWSYSSKNVRIQIPVGVSYNCDIKLAEKLMLEAAGKVERVLKTPPPIVWLKQYGDSSVDFIIQCWISDPEGGVGNIQSDVLKALWDLFQENEIEIPFPQRDINLRGNAQMDQLIAAIAQRIDSKK